MHIRFIHTADIHLGKTYRNSPGEAERYEDFFLCLSGIVKNALREKVDFILIAGDLFHTVHGVGPKQPSEILELGDAHKIITYFISGVGPRQSIEIF